MTSRLIIGTALSAVLLGGFVTWRLQAPRPAATDDGVLVDRSDSVQNPCDALGGEVQHVLQSTSGTAGSSLTIFITGDGTSANEPRLLLSAPAPTRQRLMKGKKHEMEEQRSFIATVKKSCEQQPTTRISPIYIAIREAVKHRDVQSQAAERRLTVITDLRENVDQQIKKAITQPLGTKSSLPAAIDNSNVTILICGYAQTRDHQNFQTERLVEVWSQLFTDPRRVTFDPFCPAPE